jgi:hypothetical protein
LLDALPAALTHQESEISITGKVTHRGGELADVTGRNHVTIPPALDQVGNTAGRCRGYDR